jgi:hypothetical protein
MRKRRFIIPGLLATVGTVCACSLLSARKSAQLIAASPSSSTDHGIWDLTVLDGDPPSSTLASLAVSDIDGDGLVEIITGGVGALLWYRPATRERGIIATGEFHVGVALEDVNGDGRKEVVVGHRIESIKDREEWELCWYKPGARLQDQWTRYVIDPHISGGPHDILFADIDGDGKRELIATAMYSSTPGLFIYRPSGDPMQAWQKHVVQEGLSAEGTSVGDLNGDGRPDIISGPYWYEAPAGNPFVGAWRKHDLAVGFREMCRTAIADLNGDGRPDAIYVESEYPDGRMSWFENRLATDPAEPWVEHPIARPFNFAHSLQAWRDRPNGSVQAFVAEMAQGGWATSYNWDARLMRFDFAPGGKSWTSDLLYQGQGTHEATIVDIDGDGVVEVVGKEWSHPKVQIWKWHPSTPKLLAYRHHFLDREKPVTGTDILPVDLDGDGLKDVICASWWYRNPTWERREIPGVYQVVNAADLNGDGHPELIATTRKPNTKDWYDGLSADLCWLKAIDPLHGKWEQHAIGTGSGDWPHSTVIAPVLPGGRLALVSGYHNAQDQPRHPPEIFEIPTTLETTPWPKRVLADIPYGEEIVASDLDGDGKLDLVAGPYWLENHGDGTFEPHLLAEGFKGTSRVRVTDINGDGRPDVVLTEEAVDYQTRQASFARVAWLENTGDPRHKPFAVHVIDRVRSPHSLDVADLDGDGELELVVGEHDPFKEYRSQSRLYVYKKSDPKGRAWNRFVLDDRFEHHDGAKVFELAPGRLGIISHGWMDSLYVHLWEPYPRR